MGSLVGTILVGAHESEETLSRVMESFFAIGCDCVYVLADTLTPNNFVLLSKYQCKIVYRKWTNEFGPAREYLQQHIKEHYDFQIFLDCDDEIPSESVALIRSIVAQGTPAIYSFRYDYVSDENASTKPSSIIYRHRLFPPKDVHWKGRAHECALFPPGLKYVFSPDIHVLHHCHPSEPGRVDNYIIGLRKDLEENPNDSRTEHYLAQSLMASGVQNYSEAIDFYKESIEHGSYPQECMKAYIKISEMYEGLRKPVESMRYALEASKKAPERREPVYRIAQLHRKAERWEEMYESTKSLIALPDEYPSSGVLYIRPESYGVSACMLHVLSCQETERYDEGVEVMEKALELEPGNTNAKSNIEALKKRKNKLQVGFSNCNVFKESDQSLFLYSGPALETWTADSIKTGGIGGLETANIHMAIQLQKCGWDVTLFTECPDNEGIHGGIQHIDYRRFHEYCHEHPPQVTIVSRWNSVVDLLFPGKKILWSHDIGYGNLGQLTVYLSEERIAKFDWFFFQTQFQQDVIAERYGVPVDKSSLIRLGIDMERFKGTVQKKRHKFYYASSYDRGLSRLLGYWPEIKKAIPDATLHVAYGFNNALSIAQRQGNESFQRMQAVVKGYKDKMVELDGVTFHGRLEQDKLAKLIMSCSLWLYPTHFHETFCISAIEACAAGCVPVTSSLAALKETLSVYYPLLEGDANSLEYHEAFINEVIELSTDDDYYEEKKALALFNIWGRKNVDGLPYWSWEAQGKEWDRWLKSFIATDNKAVGAAWSRGVPYPTGATGAPGSSYIVVEDGNSIYKMSDEEAFDYINKEAGYIDQRKEEFLPAIKEIGDFFGRPVKTIVEIGSLAGGLSTYLLRLLSPDGWLICIEPEEKRKFPIEVVKSYADGRHVVHLKGKSQDPVILAELKVLMRGNPIDLCIADGSHAYKDVKADHYNMAPLMNRGKGIIFHHDITVGKPRYGGLVWREIKSSYATKEFIMPDGDDPRPGIGLIFLDEDDWTPGDDIFAMSDSQAFDYLMSEMVLLQSREEAIGAILRLRNYFLNKPINTMVEIGCRTGGSTAFFGRLLAPGGRIISIDPLHDDPCVPISGDKLLRHDKLEKLLGDRRFELLHGYSQSDDILRQLCYCLEGVSADICIIDGDHGYGAVLTDQRNLPPFVNHDRGAIVHHDIVGSPNAADVWSELKKEYICIDVISDTPGLTPPGIGLILFENTEFKEAVSLRARDREDVIEELKLIWDACLPGDALIVESNVTDILNIHSLREAGAFTGFSVESARGMNGKVVGKFIKPSHGKDKRYLEGIIRKQMGVDESYPELLYSELDYQYVPYMVSFQPTKVSIIIPSYNQLESRTKQCVKTVEGSVHIPYEIIIVDDGSDDGTYEYFRDKRYSILRSEKRQGITAAYNAAIKEANGEYIFILQNDVDIPDGALEVMIGVMDDRPDIGLLGPSLTVKKSEVRVGNHIDEARSVGQRLEWILPGRCVLARRDELFRVGLYDENLYNAYEDHDLCHKFHAEGKKVAVLDNVIFDIYKGTESIMCDQSIYTAEERARRYTSVYYNCLKWDAHFNEGKAMWVLQEQKDIGKKTLKKLPKISTPKLDYFQKLWDKSSPQVVSEQCMVDSEEFNCLAFRSALAHIGLRVMDIRKDGLKRFRIRYQRPSKQLDKHAISKRISDVVSCDIVYPDILKPPGHEIKIHRNALVCEPVLSIIVKAHGRLLDGTKPCLEQLKAGIKSLNYELIGVDDGSDDGTYDFFKEKANIAIQIETRAGITAATNLGIKEARGKYICIMDNDFSISPGVIEGMLATLKDQGNIGLIGPHYGKESAELLSVHSKKELGRFLGGWCLMMRRNLLEKIGGFDEYIYNFGVDRDLSYSVMDLNHSIAEFNKPLCAPLSASANSIINSAIYTKEEQGRRMAAVYYLFLKWGYPISSKQIQWLFDTFGINK